MLTPPRPRTHPYVPRRTGRTRIVLAGTLAAGLTALGAAVASPATGQGLTPVNFSATGAMQTWSVPPGVQSVGLTMTGGAGGAANSVAPTYALTATATLTIPPGVAALDVAVGTPGEPGFASPSGRGGWPNGGSSSTNGSNWGGGGGGSTDIRPSGAPFTSALIVTGGAGGAGGMGSGSALGVSVGGMGGYGGFDSAGPGLGGDGADGGAGGAGGSQPNASTGQGGNGASGPNLASGSGGGGGGGWMGGGAGSPGTTDSFSLLSGGGGGGGGGIGTAVPEYVTAGWSYQDNAPGAVQIEYLTIATSTIPALAVGVAASWDYDAGPGATYALISGTLPPGLTLDGNSGQVVGVPTQASAFTFTIEASVYPDGAHPVRTTTTTTVTVNTGDPADLVATSATGIGTTSATLNGMVAAGGTPVTGITCAYSTTDPSGNAIASPRVAATPATVNPSPTGAATAITCPVTGLVGNQVHYFQVQGTQQASPVRSNTASFTTGSSPAQPVALQARDVRQTTATGDGQVSANQDVTAIGCDAATDISGLVPPPSPPFAFTAAPASTTGVALFRPVSCAFTGLTPNSVYHFALFAADASGTAISPQMPSFTTQVSPPRVGTVTAGNVESTSAAIQGSVIPTNEAVNGIFCVIIPSPGNPARGTAVPATPFQVGPSPVERDVTCNLSGLAPSTTYLVRMEASDRDGTAASGNVLRFTTQAPAPPPAGPAPTPSPDPTPATAPAVGIASATALANRRIILRVRVNQPGTIRVNGSYRPRSGRTTALACSAAITVARAGTFTVPCPLLPRTRVRLAAGPVRIALRATLTVTGGRSATAARTVRVPRFPPRVPPVTG